MMQLLFTNVHICRGSRIYTLLLGTQQHSLERERERGEQRDRQRDGGGDFIKRRQSNTVLPLGCTGTSL